MIPTGSKGDNNVRAILIDPFKREVTEINIDPSLDNLYETLAVEMITVLRWGKDHALILDDEGLLKDRETMEYWRVAGADQPFAGKGLILGDNYGDNRDATLTLSEVQTLVTFLDKATVNPDDWTGWTIRTF
jgi:hypothetical protein